jgi:hypothetical protein
VVIRQKQKKENNVKSYVKAMLLAAGAALLATGCVIHAHNAGSGEGEGHGSSSGHLSGSGSGSAGGSASGSANVHGSGKGSGKASGKTSGNGNAGYSKDPAKGIGRAKTPSKFHIPGAKDSAKPRKDLQIMKNGKKDQLKPHKDLGRTPPGNAGTTEEPPTQEEPQVQDPPAEPSDNDFGYTEPVYGCFQGEVMFIEPNSPKLPTNYSGYSVAATLYACEWDIPVRSFDSGFPGVEDQFEWFAIRYTGAFSVAEAGTYTFRINSDDGTRLTIDGNLVVDNDGTHPPQSKSGTIELTAGDHNLVLEYFQGPRYHIALQVYVTAPGGEEGIFSVRE